MHPKRHPNSEFRQETGSWGRSNSLPWGQHRRRPDCSSKHNKIGDWHVTCLVFDVLMPSFNNFSRSNSRLSKWSKIKIMDSIKAELQMILAVLLYTPSPSSAEVGNTTKDGIPPPPCSHIKWVEEAASPAEMTAWHRLRNETAPRKWCRARIAQHPGRKREGRRNAARLQMNIMTTHTKLHVDTIGLFDTSIL